MLGAPSCCLRWHLVVSGTAIRAILSAVALIRLPIIDSRQPIQPTAVASVDPSCAATSGGRAERTEPESRSTLTMGPSDLMMANVDSTDRPLVAVGPLRRLTCLFACCHRRRLPVL